MFYTLLISQYVLYYTVIFFRVYLYESVSLLTILSYIFLSEFNLLLPKLYLLDFPQ